MTAGQTFTKIGKFIENGQIFMPLNCNCAKLANFPGHFFRQSAMTPNIGN